MSSSLDTLLKLSKTTYPQKLFANDCVTLVCRTVSLPSRLVTLMKSCRYKPPLSIKRKCIYIYAALRNHMWIVFEEMSSWTALTIYLGTKTTFQTKYIYRNVFGLLSCRFKVLRVIEESAHLKKYSSLQERAHTIGF